MYKLFWDPGSANMAPHALLEEIGQPYELVRVDTKSGAHKRPEYLKLNPNGRVPTLVDGDHVMYESAAILLYLAEKHPGTGLAPPVGTRERMLFLQWLMYLTNTVQDAFMLYFHGDQAVDSEAARVEIKAKAEQRLEKMWATVDAALAANGPYLTGAQCSGADIFLHMLARWGRGCTRRPTSFPQVGKLVDLVKSRPAVQRMMAQEGLDPSF